MIKLQTTIETVHKVLTGSPSVSSKFIAKGKIYSICYDIATEKIADLFTDTRSVPHHILLPDIGQAITEAPALPIKRSRCTVYIRCNSSASRKDAETFRTAYRSYFENLLIAEKFARRNLLLKALMPAICSLPFFAVSNYMSTLNSTINLVSMLTEILNVGGWMLMWEALTNATLRLFNSIERSRAVKFLLNAEIIFQNIAH